MPGTAAPRRESILEQVPRLSVSSETYPEAQRKRRSTYYKKDFARSSTFVITTHFLKSLFGPALLSMPGGFQNGGLIFSAFGFVALLALIAYNIKRLIIIAAHLTEREKIPVRTYDEVAYVSFYTCNERTRRHATSFKLFINVLFFIAYFDACTIFMIFVARHFEYFLKLHFPDSFLTVRYILFFQVVLLMGMSTLRDLKYLAFFSFIGCALFLCCIVLTVACIIDTGVSSPLQRSYVGSLRTTLLFPSVVLYCLSGISIALTLKSSMKNPKHFFLLGGVYNLSLTAVCIVFLSFGVLGYAKFGENTSCSLMLKLPEEHPLSLSAKIFCISSVFFTSPIIFYVAFNVIWSNYLKPQISPPNLLFAEQCSRYCMIAFSFLLAMAIPDLCWMVPLKGAIFHSHLEVTIPAILDYVTFYPEKGNGKYRYRQLKAIFIISCGLFIFVSGIAVCLWTVIDNLKA